MHVITQYGSTVYIGIAMVYPHALVVRAASISQVTHNVLSMVIYFSRWYFCTS